MRTAESFETNRWIWRVNIALQVVLVATVVVLMNYIGMLLWYRFDLTRNRAFSLSAETKAEVAKLNRHVSIVVTLLPDEEDEALAKAFRDVRGILREFEYAARGNNNGGSIEVTFLNIYQQRRLAEQRGVADLPNAIVFECEGSKPRQVFLNDLYTVQDRTLKQFKGEKVFTSALLDVSGRDRPVLYFLTGHGEMQIEDVNPTRGASDLDAQLIARNFETRTLDLSTTRRIPAEAIDNGMILVLAPTTELLRSDEDLLRDYMTARAGRMLIALEPGRPHGLDRLLEDWGILADEAVVVERNPAYQIPGGDILIRSFAAHPVTLPLAEFRQFVLFGRARPARADPGRPLDNSLEVADLIATSPDSWGESAWRIQNPPVFEPARDLRGPVVVGASSERKVPDTSVRGGRLVVFGGSDFIVNQRLGTAGNFTLLLNALNWTLNRDSNLEIPARPVEQLELTMSQQQLAIARVSILFGPALFVAMIGGLVYLARRR